MRRMTVEAGAKRAESESLFLILAVVSKSCPQLTKVRDAWRLARRWRIIGLDAIPKAVDSRTHSVTSLMTDYEWMLR